MSEPAIILKPGREKSILSRHPWIFSGGVEKLPDLEDGAIVAVRDASGQKLGEAYFNRRCSILARMLSFGKESGLDALQRNIRAAIAYRKYLGRDGSSKTDSAARLINAESDQIPGLIVDRFADVLVLQIGTLGIDKLRTKVIEILQAELNPKSIYEKSSGSSRKEEGLGTVEGLASGESVEQVEIVEQGIKFLVQLKNSQKTGFFLDQREMRGLLGTLSSGRKVLNCFSYTGAFSVYAAKGGASRVESVEISESALTQSRHHFSINGLNPENHSFVCADVFDYLRALDQSFDIIVLDPPAFAKKKSHLEQAQRGYHDITRLALQKVAPSGLVLTCSCSHYFTEDMFQRVIFHAARDANRHVRLVQKHRLSIDHPVGVFHPESSYLKSYLLQVD